MYSAAMEEIEACVFVTRHIAPNLLKIAAVRDMAYSSLAQLPVCNIFVPNVLHGVCNFAGASCRYLPSNARVRLLSLSPHCDPCESSQRRANCLAACA
jgi:hypothetical protein